jgi:hypothetical protein
MNIRLLKIQRLQQIVLALLVLAPVTAQAQTPEERIERAIGRARDAGIPVSLLESKRAEGQAKGVPLDRIAATVETRLQHLETAKQVMGRVANDVDAGQLSVGADAIGAGVSEAVLAEVTAAAGRDRRSVAVAALTYLVSQEGLASDVALTRVKAALAQSPQALTNLARRSSETNARISDGTPATGSRGAAAASSASGSRPSTAPQANRPRPSGPPVGPPAGARSGRR